MQQLRPAANNKQLAQNNICVVVKTVNAYKFAPYFMLNVMLIALL